MNKLIQLTGFTAAVLFGVTGCASKGSYFNRSIYSDTATLTNLVSLPVKDVESQSEIGKSMVSTSKRYKAISLDHELTHIGKYSDSYDFLLTVPAGLLIANGNDDQGIFFEATKPITFKYRSKKDNKDGEPENFNGGVYIPNNSNQPTEVFWYWNGTRAPQNDLHAGISYEKALADKEGRVIFKRELVYSGISQNTVSVLYREFLDDMARPAFYQELKYDLNQGNVIGYKGARFEIIKANNTMIRYKVMQPLDGID